ncbi:MAG: LptF/LptG family permease [Akkermansiaceae bacterium]
MLERTTTRDDHSQEFMPAHLKKYLIPLILLLIGVAGACVLIPYEKAVVAEQFIGYPNSHRQAHDLRIWLLGALCALPFICSVGYYCMDRLDRYTLRIFFNAFLICFGALFIIMFLEDFQDNISDFQQSDKVGSIMLKHYLTKMPALIVFILPYSLMLSLLWALGKMSKSQELVSIIQTGRGVVRFTRPLVFAGVICTIICLIFNYHWAPYAESQEDLILAEAKGKTSNAAESVAFQNRSDTRHWLVGSFPFAHASGEPLKSIEITTLDANNKATQKILADQATWSMENRQWTLHNPITFDLIEVNSDNPQPVPVTVSKTDLVTDWKETPWQIINPGLKAPYLGIPGLKSWLANHHDNPLSDKRSYQTHLYYRIAQPFICLIIILLAAPLGIVLNRRGVGGGIAIAIFLCAGMIFCSTVFPTLGESGHLPPLIAAWATNILFGFIALILFYRRITGQPIYQTIKNLIPNGQ